MKTEIKGRLTRDCEVKYTPQGIMIAKFTVAYDVGKGQTKKTGYIDCELWDKWAQNINMRLKKGVFVIGSGYMGYESWDDSKTGQKRTKHKIVATEIYIVQEQKNQNNYNQNNTYNNQNRNQNNQNQGYNNQQGNYQKQNNYQSQNQQQNEQYKDPYEEDNDFPF